jgi:hypothetical protein
MARSARPVVAQSSACRPPSVIPTRTTSIGRLPACTISGVAVANPSRTRTINISIVKPCANKIASVQPRDKPASNLSARWSAPSRDFCALIAIARR